MKIQTLTVVVGNKACNAKCPYCVSKLTPECGIKDNSEINLRNFDIACRFALRSGVSTILFTGKGEPTLHKDDLHTYLCVLDRDKSFPFIEMQTNGIALADGNNRVYLKNIYNLGVTTISISVTHYLRRKNSEIMYPNSQFDYWELVDILHDVGFSVRLNCTMFKGGIDNYSEVLMFLDYCKRYKVEQMTFRPVTNFGEGNDVSDWIKQHNVDVFSADLHSIFENEADFNKLLEMSHGATVYNYHGQNVCLSNCLTGTEDINNIRQLIFFPDGHLRYDWRYEGAILL